MRKRWLLAVLVLLAALALVASDASAQGRGKGRGNGGFSGRVTVVDRDFDRRDHGRVVFGSDRGFFDSGRPPGWDRGRKVGWGNCDLPPGQAKKYGCRTTFFGRTTTRQPRVIIVQPRPRHRTFVDLLFGR